MFGETLNKYMELVKCSGKKLSEYTGISESTVSRYRSGERVPSKGTELEKLCRGRTTIMIAHRLSTLRDCENLYVIEHGSVAESGTHAQLIRQKGIYFKLYTLQYEALKNAGVEE